MAVPIEKTAQTAAWVDKNIRPLIASLAGQGKIDGIEAMALLDGLDGLLALVKFVEKHGEAIKRAAAGG